jgi:hypothetical protein
MAVTADDKSLGGQVTDPNAPTGGFLNGAANAMGFDLAGAIAKAQAAAGAGTLNAYDPYVTLAQQQTRVGYPTLVGVSNGSPAYVGSTLDQNAGASTAQYEELLAPGSYIKFADDPVRELLIKLLGKNEEKYDGLFRSAAEQAAYLTWKTGKPVSIEDVLSGNAPGVSPGDLVNKAGSDNGYGTKTNSYTNKTVSLSNRGEANRIVDAALTTALGRRATQAEQAQFLGLLNQNQRANPEIQTQNSTVTTSEGGTSSSYSTTQKGGFDAQNFGDQYARAQDGYAEYQAATTYMDAFAQTLAKKTQERLV